MPAALIIAYLVSLIPAVIIYFWLKDRMYRQDTEYKVFCRTSLLQGIRSVLLVMLFSASFALFGNIVLFKERTGLAYDAYRTFSVFAFSEETAKFLTFRKLLKQSETPCSALDMICSMTLVGLGFEIIESVVYAFGTSPGQMLVRGITAMHAGYGFIMGWFYARSRFTGKKVWAVLGFVIPFLLHGAYDFGLSESFSNLLGENYAFLSVSLAIFALVVLIWLFVFTAKARKNPVYTEPL